MTMARHQTDKYCDTTISVAYADSVKVRRGIGWYMKSHFDQRYGSVVVRRKLYGHFVLCRYTA